MEYLEDVTVGARTEVGQHTFTADEIKAFARQYDPQPFHLDEAAAARSLFGGLCASGWHSAVLWMRLTVDHHRRRDAERRARGEPVARLGLSPGFRELKWLKPVYVGDTITYASEVFAKRPSKSRPGWGLMTIRNTGTNQAGELVLSFVSTAFVECRPAFDD
jgi:acyl dehydratase